MSADPALHCQEREGFLFRHNCPYRAVLACGQCGKAVCDDHARDLAGKTLCIGCRRQAMREEPAGHRRRRRMDDDPYFYDRYWYPGYGHYGHGRWGSRFYHDESDFTEADGQGLGEEGDEAFEQDMEES